MKIAPNPSTNAIHITLYGEINGINRIEIRTTLGELLISIEQPKNETVVDVSNFANGIYYVSGYGSDAPIHSKLIKQ